MECEDEQNDVRAMIDTGATLCGIRSGLADKLGLKPIDNRYFGDSTKRTLREVYLVDIVFPDDDWRDTFEVAGCPFADSDMEFVLGRNFLSIASFAYDGQLGTFSLEF
ncbi:MAG: retropepsin-like aspartic protease [Acidimicrobiia bacterium]